METAIRYEDWAPYIKRAAGRFLRRARAAGASTVTVDDIVSELSVAWCMARDGWNPQFNVPFGAYLARGMINHINRFLKKEIGAAQFAPYSTNARFQEDDDTELGDMLASREVSQEQFLIEKLSWERAVGELSPRAKRFIELLESPPPELYEQVTALQARAIYARERGIDSFAVKGVTGGLVLDFMGASRTERTAIYKEIKILARKVSQ